MSVLLRIIDLRPLQPVGIIHINGLPLGVELNGSQPALAMSIACGFGASERQRHLGADGGRVDIGYAGIDVAHGPESIIHIARVNSRRAAIGHAIRYLTRLVETITGNEPY